MSSAKLVAVVEDDVAIRDNYLAGLRRQGYRVAGYGTRKEALAGFASRSPDLVIIDVRIERDWESATLKIPGAVWEDFFEVETWAEKYPKDKTIVLYCD